MLTVDLSGRVALVTGASRGIGLAIALKLAEAGASVVLTARSMEDDVLQQFEAVRPSSAIAICGAIEQPAFVSDLLKQIFARFKRLDVLVNNAGIMRPGVIGMIAADDINETLHVNLGSVIHVTQAAARLMGRTGGSIINISSIVGVQGTAGQLAYAASKAGVIGVTKASAKELAPKGIRVNAIAPGYIQTQMTANLGEDVKAKTLQTIGMGRAGVPAEIADAALFFASDLSAYVTGQVLGVDGGMVL